MRHLHALALALTLTACGASAGPAPAGDAGSDDAPADTANGCPARHARIGDRCVSLLSTACGDPPVPCPSGQSCALVGGGGTPTVQCVAD